MYSLDLDRDHLDAVDTALRFYIANHPISEIVDEVAEVIDYIYDLLER